MLIRAILSHDEAEVGLLLENGADPTLPDRDGVTPLLHATKIRNVRIATLLLVNRADIDARNYAHSWTPLHQAIKYGSEQLARLLLEYNPDLSQKDAWGNSALHLSIYGSSENLLKRILENKPDLEDRTSGDGKTALHIAVGMANFAKSTLLLEHGADVNAQVQNTGWTAMHEVAKSGDLALARILLDYGANVDLEDNYGFTPRMRARLNNNIEVLELI
jgi:ankyrin repeat protein